MRIEIVIAWPRLARQAVLVLQEGATVAEAIAASGWVELGLLDGVDGQSIFGERVDDDSTLHDGDRLELLRPLQVDPKEARRLRADKVRG